MDFKVVYTKSFNGYIRGLHQQGHKKVVQAVRAAISEAGMTGEIQSIPRTKHGETRIPDVEKYDLRAQVGLQCAHNVEITSQEVAGIDALFPCDHQVRHQR